MKRRTLLFLVVAGAGGTAGCLSRTSGGNRTTDSNPNAANTSNQIDMPEQVESIDFSILEEGADPLAGPTIEFDSAKNQLRITGTMWAGNPCHEARVDSLHYEKQTNELEVLVAVEKVRSGCPDSLGTNTYEVVITMSSELPETVTAMQEDSEGASETTTASPA
ncbi:hypothetical protein [Halosolutus halophilus]|uniref:hypothetical protein n=1 Tax=Halosolutus halophilus TaxID=1552990 RepID=UPI002234F0DB|nr:hypothetical protein [Halosolutus halophilus]